MSIKNILLLDDDRLVHLLVQQLSRKENLPWRIRHVYFWKEALRLIEERPFDLLLSDVHLQQNDMVWDLIHLIPQNVHLPVILVSSAADSAVHQKASTFPRIKAVIDKPLPITQIAQIHQQFLLAPQI